MIHHDFKIKTRPTPCGGVEWLIVSNAGVVRATAGREIDAEVIKAALDKASAIASDEEVDAQLEAVLRAAGTSLRHYSIPKTIEAMRTAMRAAMGVRP